MFKFRLLKHRIPTVWQRIKPPCTDQSLEALLLRVMMRQGTNSSRLHSLSTVHTFEGLILCSEAISCTVEDLAATLASAQLIPLSHVLLLQL